MRAHQILFEYDRARNIAQWGDSIINTIGNSKTYQIPSELYHWHTLVDIAMNPDSYPEFKEPDGAWLIALPIDINDSQKTINIRINKKNAKELLNQYKSQLLNVVMDVIEQYDPTPDKKYMPWLTRAFRHLNEYSLAWTHRLLSIYDAAKKRNLLKPEHKDIMRISGTPENLYYLLHSDYNWDELIEKSFPKNSGKVKVIYKGDEGSVVIPLDHEASCRYGSSTWCTAKSTDPKTFKGYISRGDLIIITPAKKYFRGEKYQLYNNEETGSMQFMDANNEPISFNILTERFPKATEQILKHYPLYTKVIALMPKNDLVEVSQTVFTMITEHALVLIQDNGLEDTGYIRLLQKNGCIDEAGEPDMERIERLGLTYLEYSPESQRDIAHLNKLTKIDYSEIVKILDSYENQDYTTTWPPLYVAALPHLLVARLYDDAGLEEINVELADKLVHYTNRNIMVITDHRYQEIVRDTPTGPVLYFQGRTNPSRYVSIDKSRVEQIGSYKVIQG